MLKFFINISTFSCLITLFSTCYAKDSDQASVAIANLFTDHGYLVETGASKRTHLKMDLSLWKIKSELSTIFDAFFRSQNLTVEHIDINPEKYCQSQICDLPNKKIIKIRDIAAAKKVRYLLILEPSTWAYSDSEATMIGHGIYYRYHVSEKDGFQYHDDGPLNSFLAIKLHLLDLKDHKNLFKIAFIEGLTNFLPIRELSDDKKNAIFDEYKSKEDAAEDFDNPDDYLDDLHLERNSVIYKPHHTIESFNSVTTEENLHIADNLIQNIKFRIPTAIESLQSELPNTIPQIDGYVPTEVF